MSFISWACPYLSPAARRWVVGEIWEWVSRSLSVLAVESIILQWLTLQPAQDIGSDAPETGIGDGIYANRFFAPTLFQVSEPVSMFFYWKSPLSQSGVFWEMYRGKWVMCPIPRQSKRSRVDLGKEGKFSAVIEKKYFPSRRPAICLLHVQLFVS